MEIEEPFDDVADSEKYFWCAQNQIPEKIVECESVSWNVLRAVDDEHYWWDRFSLDPAGVKHSPEVSWVVGN